jgi:pyruvate formate lyase activating enzyme
MVKIAGLERVSLIDYPEKISAIIFTHGCNLRCSFCHNPELVLVDFDSNLAVKESELFEYLEGRKGKIDAVVITGGEPLLHKDIGKLIKKIKDIGYLVKLDSNGFFPKELKRLISKGLIDYIAMDVKWPEDSYVKYSGDVKAVEKIKNSISIIENSGIAHEFRTTVVKGIHGIEDIGEIVKMLPKDSLFYIQNFRAGKTINPSLNNSNSFTEKELKDILKVARKYLKNSHVR